MLDYDIKDKWTWGKRSVKIVRGILAATAMSLTLSNCSSTRGAEETIQEQTSLETKVSETSRAQASKEIAKESSDEFTYVITLPQNDNSGNKIKQEVYDQFMARLSDYFGGVSMQPIVYGCWHDSEHKKLMCEPNAVFSSSRDCDDKAALKERFGTDDCAEIAERYDRPFVNAVAKEYGIMLGQSTVYVQENAATVSFVAGQRKDKLSADLVKR